MELARGTIGDRPWGTTLFGFAKRATNGELVVSAGEQRCCIAWRDGAIVGAASSFAADSVARIALTNHFVTSTQVGEIVRRIAASSAADEVDIVAEVAGLAAQQTEKLRRRVVEQRASRTFAIEEGTYVVEDRIAIAVAAACEIDVRAVIFLGAHKHLAEQRLAIELRQLGSHFTLEPDAFDELYRFGFGDGETPILQALRAGTSVPELETVRELDPRTARAVIYALASCDAVTRMTVPRAPTPPVIDLPPDTSPVVFRTPTSPNVARTLTPIAPRTSTAPNVPRTPTPPTSGIALARVPTVRASSPHIDGTAPPFGGAAGRGQAPAVETAGDPSVARTSSKSGPAVARTPSNPAVGRAASKPIVGRTPTAPNVPRTITSSDNRQLAAEAYERGNRAVRAEDLEQAVIELARACELSPSNVDYQALLGWARFCLATDKEAIVAETRKVLEKAIYKSEQPLVARFYLGRVERMVGREREALRHFHEVLDADPNHKAAATEIRILEARLAANAKR